MHTIPSSAGSWICFLNASISGRQSPRAFCAGALWAGPWIFFYKNLNASIPGRQSSACFPCYFSGAGPAFRLSLACLCCRRNLVTERRWNAVQQLTGLPRSAGRFSADPFVRRVRACRSPRPRSGCRARRVRSWAPSACSSRSVSAS